MLDQPLTRPQAMSILIMFTFGSSVVMGVSTSTAQDSWISLLVAAVYALPVLFVYARIASLNPGEALFTTAERLLGKVLGKVVTALMSWYALHLCALVLRNFSEFIQVSALVDTPQLPIILLMAVTAYTLARSGGKALGKWALAVTPLVLGIVVLTIALSVSIMQPRNFLPVLEYPIGQILREGYSTFAFPLGETVLLLGMADFLRPSDGPYRIYIGGTMLGTLVMMAIVVRNLLILGATVVSVQYFPSYIAASIINLGDFLSRIEGSISVNFMLAGITKLTLCLIVASRGIASLFGIQNWRNLVAPTALLSVMLAQILFVSTMEMFNFIKYYGAYAIPFQVLLPLVLWVASEIRARRGAPRAAGLN